jgi:hypothetical protein
MFADDQVADSEDALQICVHKLEKITSKHRIKISTSKVKTVAFKGRDTVRSTLIISNNIIKQTNIFNYLGCSISYQNEKDITVKLLKCLQITELSAQL